MIQPRYPRLFSLAKSVLIEQNLPTGKGFGGSSLQAIQTEELVFLSVNDSVFVTNYADLAYHHQSSPLVVEAGKILIVALWFWCLVGANFCFDSIGTVLRYGAQDI